MNDADRALADLAARQRQVFTRAQAHAAGLSSSDVSYRLHRGLLVRHGSHTLRFAGTTLDYRGQLMSGLLDLGPAAMVSATAAAALHELDGFADGPLFFLVPRSVRGRRTIGVVTSTPSIAPLDCVTIDGLRVTSGTRTVAELVGRCTQRELGNALDSAVRKGLTAPWVVRNRLIELGRVGRRGIAVFDEVMKSAGVESWLERRFLKLIRGSGLPVPAVQRIYHKDGQHVARVDFDFDPLPVVVEVGGRRGYMSAEERQRKERRRNALQLVGRIVYFFSTEDVTQDPTYVVDTIRAGLGLAA